LIAVECLMKRVNWPFAKKLTSGTQPQSAETKFGGMICL
jgi:hypothetical protein